MNALKYIGIPGAIVALIVFFSIAGFERPYVTRAEGAEILEKLEQLTIQQSSIAQNIDWTMHGFLQIELDRVEKEGGSLRERRELIDKLNVIRVRIGLSQLARP